MPLTVELPFGEPLAAIEVIRRLAPNRPLEYRATVLLPHSDRDKLAAAIAAGSPVSVTLKAGGSSLNAGPLRLVGCRELGFATELVAGPAVPAPATVRAITRPATAADVLTAVSDVLAVSTAILNELSAIKLPNDKNTCFIQDGGTSADRIAFALGCLVDFAAADWARLAVVSNPGGNPPLRAVWASRSVYERTKTADAHTLKFEPTDGREDSTFDTRHDRSAVVRHRRDRPFTLAAWWAWCGREPPFLDGGLALETSDRLFATGTERVGWDTAVVCGPVADPISPRLTAWTGTGIVEAWEAPWLRVRLVGFDPGRDVAVAQLLTGCSGSDGAAGWHILPAPNSTVELSWSGRLRDALRCHGNNRSAVPKVAAPSAVFDDPLTVQVPGLTVTVKNDVNLSAKGATVKVTEAFGLEAGKEVVVKGGGGVAQWKNGKFQAGK